MTLEEPLNMEMEDSFEDIVSENFLHVSTIKEDVRGS